MNFPELILASKSPRRRRLLRQIGLKFKVMPSYVEEKFSKGQSPSSNAKRIALEKAQEVSARVGKGIVVGADTIVVANGTILGKPRDVQEAKRMLKLLSNKEHTVYTGFALVNAKTGAIATDVEKTTVRFRRLSNEEIDRYVASGSPMDKAGAYGIQDDMGAVFIEKVNGCFYNVVGFPLTRFYTTLQEFVKKRASKRKRERRWNKR